MSETKFVLGPKQREWIKSLRYHVVSRVAKTEPKSFIGWDDIGLITSTGFFKKGVPIGGSLVWCLIDLMKLGWSFKNVADYVEANPENVFTKSV